MLNHMIIHLTLFQPVIHLKIIVVNVFGVYPFLIRTVRGDISTEGNIVNNVDWIRFKRIDTYASIIYFVIGKLLYNLSINSKFYVIQ